MKFIQGLLRVARSRGYGYFTLGCLVASAYYIFIYSHFMQLNVPLALMSTYSPPVFQVPDQVNKEFVQIVVDQTNIERKKVGLIPLKENSALSYVAYLRARDILKFQSFSHEATRGGEIYSDYMGKVIGYRYQKAGENLALSYIDPNLLVKDWLNSPDHRENIFNKDYNETGVAVLSGTYYGVPNVNVTVQLFGSLR